MHPEKVYSHKNKKKTHRRNWVGLRAAADLQGAVAVAQGVQAAEVLLVRGVGGGVQPGEALQLGLQLRQPRLVQLRRVHLLVQRLALQSGTPSNSVVSCFQGGLTILT